MNLNAVIIRLRAQATSFANRVAGAAEFEAAEADAPGIVKPNAWVIPLTDESTVTEITESFQVVVQVDAKLDERGQDPTAVLDTTRDEILLALNFWEMDTDHRPVRYVGGSLLSITRESMFYGFAFEVVAVETKIVTYEITLRVEANSGATLATVLTEAEAAIEAVLGATTQLDSDLLEETFEDIPKGSTRYQLAAIPMDVGFDSNVSYDRVGMHLRVHRRLADVDTERTYTRGDMLTQAATLLDKQTWLTTSVRGVIDLPDLTFPGDLVRV